MAFSKGKRHKTKAKGNEAWNHPTFYSCNAQKLDRAWFNENPGRIMRLRSAVPYELTKCGQIKSHTHTFAVIVIRYPDGTDQRHALKLLRTVSLANRDRDDKIAALYGRAFLGKREDMTVSEMLASLKRTWKLMAAA
jgi:hypothetical protein